MPTLWFWLVALMIAMYVVLDGFDLGAAIAGRFVARTPEERRLVLRSIGPLWDGQRGLPGRRRRHPLLRLPRPVRGELQRLLPAAHGGALAAHRTRRRDRAARPRRPSAWWIPGMLLAASYTIYVYRSFAGKVELEGSGAGH